MIIKRDNIIDFFNEKAFLISVFLLMSMYTLRFSYLTDIRITKYLFLIMRLISYSLVACKLLIDILNKKYSKKEVMIYIIIGLYMMLISYNSRTVNYLIYYIYIIVGKNVRYSRIIKTAFFALASSIAIIISFFAAGIIREDIYITDSIRGERHSLGFRFASYISTYLLYTILYYIYYRNKKIKLVELLIMAIVVLIVYRFSKTRNAMILSIFAIIITAFVNNSKKISSYNIFYKIILCMCPIIFPLSILFLSLMYTNDNPFLNKLNHIISGRLSLGHIGLIEHPVKLFGQYIKFSAVTDGDIKYNVIDSSYMLYLLILGSVFFVLMIIFLLYFCSLINKKRDIYLCYIFILLLAHSMFDPQLLQMSHSAFMYILSYKNEIINYE